MLKRFCLTRNRWSAGELFIRFVNNRLNRTNQRNTKNKFTSFEASTNLAKSYPDNEKFYFLINIEMKNLKIKIKDLNHTVVRVQNSKMKKFT